MYASSGVINDACTDGGTPFADIKFSTCKQDQFTCYDGQCIDIEHRYLCKYCILK